MPIPDYETLLLPVLKRFADGARNVSDCVPLIRAEYGISEDEAQELLPSGRVTVLQSRIHWARTYLSKAGLLESPKRNFHKVTPLGLKVLASTPPRIDNTFLNQFPAFKEWRERARQDQSSKPETQGSAAGSPAGPENDTLTPEDSITAAFGILNATLRDDLIAIMHAMSPIKFERLILDLLAAMGYGGGDLQSGRMTKTTGDGGIDGVIDEDALGLDAVYIQAKRYAPDIKVGRPDMQRFVGSLTGENATKGVFVTTSDFSRDALDYVNRVQHRIRLINGQRLAALMIQYGVGVRERVVYSLRTIDEDYFDPDVQ